MSRAAATHLQEVHPQEVHPQEVQPQEVELPAAETQPVQPQGAQVEGAQVQGVQADGGVVATARPDAPVPPPTPEQARAARQLALAGQVYALVGAPAREGDMRTLTTTLEVQIAAALTDKDRARAVAIVDAVDDAVADIEPQVAQAAVKAMAQAFTTEELQDMLGFYQSPSGRAVLRKLPPITRQSLATAVNVLPELMAGVEGDFCAKVRCSAKDHEAFAAAAARLNAARPGPRPQAHPAPGPDPRPGA